MRRLLSGLGSIGVLRPYAVLYLLALYAPLAVLAVLSFNDSTYLTFPFQGFTLRWYAMLADKPELLAAFWNSLRLGACVALVSTLLGALAAAGLTLRGMRGKGLILGVLSLPMLLPGIVLGVSLLAAVTWAGQPLSLLTIGAGHVVICAPFATMVMVSRFEGFDLNLVEASKDLGEDGLRTFLRVTLPVNLPGVIASLLLTFTLSFDEFILAFFLGGAEATLPLYIWGQLRFPNELPSVLALSTCMLLLTALIVPIAVRLQHKGVAGTPRDDGAGFGQG